MKINSLFLFLSMMFVWAGLCSAQTTSDKYYLINGYFFKGMPPGIRTDIGAKLIILTDKDGNIIDVKVSYNEGYAEQMLRYSKEFANLPYRNE